MNKISRRECTLKAVGWVYVGVCVLYLCFVGHLESDKRGYIIIKAKHKNLISSSSSPPTTSSSFPFPPCPFYP